MGLEQAKFIEEDHENEELVFGLLAPIGTNLQLVTAELKRQLEDSFNYTVETIKVSELISAKYRKHFAQIKTSNCVFCEKREKILHGTKLRKDSRDSSILAKWTVTEISKRRKNILSDKRGIKAKVDPKKKPALRVAYIVDQLKRKEEIETLNSVYGKSFFLIGAQAPLEDRLNLLTTQIGKGESFAQELIDLDQSEAEYFRSMSPCSNCARLSTDHSPLDDKEKDYGQQLSKIFSEADIFVQDNNIEKPIRRFLDLVFSSPEEFPSSSEHAMFMAFAASTRSADLSRQVGAVILSEKGDLISSGSNDVPRAGGGIYDRDNHQNDSAFGFEANSKRLAEISENIATFLVNENKIDASDRADIAKKIQKKTEIANLTEFHRAVHAEMQAILSATRSGTTTHKGSIFVTTFPCHNCAKHIVAAGLESATYVEPYAKSLARTLHKDAVALIEDGSTVENRVAFRPFVGVGPRRFLDVFSMKLSDGQSLSRKEGVNTKEFKRSLADMRFASPFHFLNSEKTLQNHVRKDTVVQIEVLQKKIIEFKNEKKDTTDLENQMIHLQELQEKFA